MAHQKYITHMISQHCKPRLILALIFIVIACRIVGLLLYTVWMFDCFFREFKMGVQCKKFNLYKDPEVISVFWLILVSSTSVILIHYARKQPQFPSCKMIITFLLGKMYFYKLCIILILVISYDLITILGKIEAKRTMLYTTIMLEHFTSVPLMLTLNFVPKFVMNEGSSRLKITLYKIILLIYAIENYVDCAIGTIVAAYKLVSVPTCSLKQLEIKFNISRLATNEVPAENRVCHDATSVLMLLFLLTALSLRRTLGNFFLTKIFRENVDVLDMPLQPYTPLQETTQRKENIEHSQLLDDQASFIVKQDA